MAVAGEIANLIVALKLDDSGFTGKLNRVAGSLGRMDAGLSRMGRGVGQVGSGIARLGTVAAAAAVGGLAAVVTTAVSFEDAFAGVRKTVDATDEQLEALQNTFRKMAREIPLSFEALAAIGEQAGALGIAAADIEEFTRVAALIGVTTDVSADQAATSLGVLSNVLHLTAEDYDNFGATLVDLGNKGASTESAILAIAERAGAGASLIGIASDATLGWSSSIANLGIEVEAGGTALQKFFLESLRNIQDDKTLDLMAKTAGTTGKAFKQAFEKDASKALQTFVIGLGKLENAERLAVLEALGFSDIRITRALLGLAGDTDGLTSSLTIAGQAWKDNSALQVEAEKRFKTTASQIQKLKNNLRDVAFTIGAELLPVTNELITDFVAEINKPGTQAGIRAFAKDLAAGVRGLVTELKGVDFSGIIGGMKIAAEVAKGAFDAFRALPEPIQQLAIAALVANKVSGGAVGQIAKGLANIFLGGAGALGGLLGRGSSPANPMWVAAVGGFGGVAGGAPVAAAGGGLGGVIKTFLGVTTAAGLGYYLGEAIGKSVFYNPTVQPAVTFETGEIERVIAAQKPAEIAKAISAVEGALQDLKEASFPGGFDLGPISGVMQLLSSQEREVLEAQLAVLREQLVTSKANVAVNKDTFAKLREAGPLPTKPVPTLPNTAVIEGAGGVAQLPDTALTPLKAPLNTIAQNTSKLPPIISSQERAIQLTAQRVNEARTAVGRGFTELGSIARSTGSQTVMENRRTSDAARAVAAQVNASRSAIDRGFSASGSYLSRIAAKNFSPTVNVSARISNVVTVNANRVLERITEARVRTGTIPEFA